MQRQDSCCSDSTAEVWMWSLLINFLLARKYCKVEELTIIILNVCQLPLYLYLLRDLHYKLDYFTPRKQFSGRVFSAPVGFTRMTVGQFLSKITPVFPFLKRHLDSAICLLKEGRKMKLR